MSSIALARNEKSDVQIQVPAPTTAESSAISRHVPFSAVSHLIESSRALRRPNRNRPVNCILPEEVASATAAIDEVYSEHVFGESEHDELRRIADVRPPAQPNRKPALDE